MSTTVSDPTLAAAPESEKRGLVATLRKVLEGDLGELRVLIVLALIWLIFAIAADRFLSAVNLTNLALQIAAMGTISCGVVLVLLLGEIDLSVGAVAGLTASTMAVLVVKEGTSPYIAMLAALAIGAVIGAFQGTVATRLVIPSFIVTLAGLLAFQGAQLKVLGDTGTVNINDPAITNLANTFLAPWLGWAVGIAGIALFALTSLRRQAQRRSAGLELEPMANVALKIGAVAVAIVAAVLVVNQDRGVPVSLCILIGIVLVLDLMLMRTRFGRHIYSVGGNAEASRRSGINVPMVRTVVFMMASTLAAAGGILLAARQLAVSQTTGGSDLLLLSIAGPVIAGVSLFGGRGRMWGALLGALVIGSISNGMDLLALTSAVKYMVTGGVLLLAVAIDAIARQRRMHRKA